MKTRLALVLSLVLGASSSLAATHVVNVQDNSFSPSDLTICLGDTVTWQWTGMGIHTVTSGSGCTPNGAWNSGSAGNGATFSFTFASVPVECASDSSAGDNTCSYFCIPHCPNMSGVVRISDTPGAGIAISRSKLRVTTDPTAGRGGTITGVEVLDGATFADVQPGTTQLMLTLSGPALAPVSATVDLEDVRGDFMGRFAANDAAPVCITTAKITGTTDPAIDKLLVKYETNGFDLTTTGPLTAEVRVRHVVQSGDCGSQVVTAVGTSTVAQ